MSLNNWPYVNQKRGYPGGPLLISCCHIVTQSNSYDLMDSSPPGSSVHGVSQLRIRQWHSTSVFLPGKSHGWRSLAGYSHGVAKSRTRLSNFTFTSHFHALERKWQPTAVFLPWESQGWGSLVGCRLWGCTELGMTLRIPYKKYL